MEPLSLLKETKGRGSWRCMTRLLQQQSKPWVEDLKPAWPRKTAGEAVPHSDCQHCLPIIPAGQITEGWTLQQGRHMASHVTPSTAGFRLLNTWSAINSHSRLEPKSSKWRLILARYHLPLLPSQAPSFLVKFNTCRLFHGLSLPRCHRNASTWGQNPAAV